MAEEKNEKLNLIQKLAAIRKIASAVSKSKKGYNYTYSDITEILAKVTAGMDKYGVSLIPSIVPATGKVEQNVVVNTKVDKQGKPYTQTVTEMLASADMNYRWVNNDEPTEYIDVPWFVTGSQSDPSQAFGSGLTYTSRQFLTNFFQIAQVENDVDAYRSKQKAAEASEDRAIAEGLVSQFDTMIKEFLADNAGKADEIKKFISKYVKNANYLSIKDPVIISKLIEDFMNTYKKEGK